MPWGEVTSTLCPDNEVDRATDIKRIRWGQADIIALSATALSSEHVRIYPPTETLSRLIAR